MADLSLGPLRIANPDDNPPDTPTRPPEPQRAAFDVSPYSEGPERHETYFTGAGPQPESSPIPSPGENSYQDANPSDSSYDPHTQISYAQRKAVADRNQGRLNLPYTYQDQQQSQFPQYSPLMQPNLHDPRMNSSRPASQYYTQLPVTTSGSGITRQKSHRSRAESANSANIPSRTTSKRTAPLPGSTISRDDAYNDRYGQTPQAAGAYPPRRTSRGIGSSRVGNTPTGNPSLSTTPMSSQTPLSSSPYNVEGGPISSSEEWKERGAAVGVQHGYDSNGRPTVKPIKKGVKDFNFGQTLGEGSYSTVLAATDRQTLKEYAIKVLDKRHIIKEKKVKYVNIEKETLNRLTDHPGVVRLYYTFQDERSLYFVLDLCGGGELLGVLKRMTTFDEECTRFYGAQILDTIEYMHSKGVIHRDLKPENVLLDDKKHIKITDFGTAKMLDSFQDPNGRTVYENDSSSSSNRASSFVGTAEYVSPELLTDKNACKASDLWAFGCIIYQLLAGRPPFKAANEYLTFQKIVALEYDFPRGFPDVARDLVERLLVLDPQRRLSLEHVKNHEFFDGIKWGKGLWQQQAPRLKSYQPPPNPPIKLNGGANQTSYPPDISGNHSTHPTILPPVSSQKPKPRVVTELPPPSQLDIEWSPVLTRGNERILKLGNLSVISSSQPHSPGHESGGVLSRLFSGNSTKRRQRLVMVTSSARIIVAAAGGEEKKSKLEIDLLSPGTEVTTITDTKGVTNWVVNTRDKHFILEDSKTSSTDSEVADRAVREWMDAVEQAKEFATAQAVHNSQYSGDEGLDMPTSGMSAASSISQSGELSQVTSGHGQSGRATLQKSQADNESMKGRKRFSKRQSKSGLTAVF